MLPLFLHRVQSLGHQVFTSGAFNLNMIGIRTISKATTFNDWITCWYRDTNGSWQSHWWAATTDPGAPWLREPMNVDGTAVLKPGQTPRMWKIGTHKGYKAFQQASSCTVYRDRDRDDEIDVGPEQTGVFGINGHASDSDPWDKYDLNKTDKPVGRWSAGCQVWADPASFRQAVGLQEQAVSMGYGDFLTYTLVLEADIFVASAR